MRVLQNDTKQMKEITHQKNLLAFYKFLPFKESAHPWVPFLKKTHKEAALWFRFPSVPSISFFNKSKNLPLVGNMTALQEGMSGGSQYTEMSFCSPWWSAEGLTHRSKCNKRAAFLLSAWSVHRTLFLSHSNNRALHSYASNCAPQLSQ